MSVCGQLVRLLLAHYPLLADVSVTISFSEHQVVVPNVRVLSLGGSRIKIVIPTPLGDHLDQPVSLSPGLMLAVSMECVRTFCAHVAGGTAGGAPDIKYVGGSEYMLPPRVVSRLNELAREGVAGSRR
jgi:hypothetical protein